MSTNPSAAPASGLLLRASTPVAGFALQNGTPTITSWTAPSDGKLHPVAVFGVQHVTSAQTGGGVQVNYTAPDGTAATPSFFPGGGAAGVTIPDNPINIIIEAGSTVSVAQSAAQTLGAATVWAQIWGG